MTAIDLANLLESKWADIRTSLPELEWRQFFDEYRDLVAALPEPPDPAVMAQAAEKIGVLLDRFDYTKPLLVEWQSTSLAGSGRGAVRVRGIRPASEMPDQMQLRAIRNRLRELAFAEYSNSGSADSEQQLAPGTRDPRDVRPKHS